jgi:hypothetical protein
MIYSPLSKYPDSSETAVAPGASIYAEGLALVRTQGNMSAGVMPSTGNTTDIFVGFSIAGTSAAPFAEGYTNKVESFTVPASGTITLTFTPVTGQVFVFDNTANAAVPTPAVVGANVNGLTPGDEVTVTYSYPLTVIQAIALYGNVQPGGYSGAYVNQIGLIKRGIIYTSMFDASKNWAAATAIKLGANGILEDQTGTGLAIDGAVIIAVPGEDVPYLAIEFSAA